MAKRVCAGCEVVVECRDYALATRQPFGVWGGLDEEERRAWAGYSEQLRELSGDAYEQAETESWQVLQRELRGLERRRRMLAAGQPASV